MSLELDLPGFRFHPTEEELLNFYLRNTVSGKKVHYDIIGLTNIYRHDPWELPGLAKIGEREWYFFVPRDRKQGSSGGRPNRTTENGFWKATGSDRRIVSLSEPKRVIGLRKTLVFYGGRAPRGSKTDWVMNEYRLPDSTSLPKDIVLCKIYRKATSLKVLEQRAATMEEVTKTVPACPSSSSSAPPAPEPAPASCSGHLESFFPPVSANQTVMFKEEQNEELVAVAKDEDEVEETNKKEEGGNSRRSTSIQLPPGCEKIPDLLMPGKISVDWTQDPFWTQMGSPWFLNLTPTASILNF